MLFNGEQWLLNDNHVGRRYIYVIGNEYLIAVEKLVIAIYAAET